LTGETIIPVHHVDKGPRLSRPHYLALAGIGLAAVAAAMLSIAAVPGARGWLGASLAAAMAGIAFVDARRFVIPDELVLASLVLGLVHAAVAGSYEIGVALPIAALRGAVMAAVFLAVRVAYRRFRGREGMGWGDIKLAAVAGVWLDWTTLPLAVEIAALAGISFYVVRQFVLKRSLSLAGRLPFGLFLAPAIWLCWLLEATLLAPF
jgi:leader peptidase (prepilin peptidase)/N-methyltransferase